MTNTFIIAEVGVNHNADLNLAYELIDIAATAAITESMLPQQLQQL